MECPIQFVPILWLCVAWQTCPFICCCCRKWGSHHIFFGITCVGDTSSPPVSGYGVGVQISTMTLLDCPFVHWPEKAGFSWNFLYIHLFVVPGCRPLGTHYHVILLILTSLAILPSSLHLTESLFCCMFNYLQDFRVRAILSAIRNLQTAGFLLTLINLTFVLFLCYKSQFPETLTKLLICFILQ